MPENSLTNIHTNSIVSLAEELWIYSKSVELLSEPEDVDYLATEIQGVRTKGPVGA